MSAPGLAPSQGLPADPLPAATLVLMRDGVEGLEVLLLQRSESASFVPGTYVFPGGRVDAEDAAPEALRHVDGLTPAGAAARLDLPDADPPAIAYYVAAVREAFEETGVLVGARSDGEPPATAADDAGVREVRDDLLERRITFADALDRLLCRVAGDEIEYFAHWITPERAPRRYDTRFFAARLRGDSEPLVDGREMTDARWFAPSAALRAHAAGGLPMILPTVRTLERLAAYSGTREALSALALAPVPTILPTGETGDFAGRSTESRLARP